MGKVIRENVCWDRTVASSVANSVILLRIVVESPVHPQGQVAPRGQVAPNAQGGQGQARGGQAPKNNRFYALHGRQEYEDVLDVVTGML